MKSMVSLILFGLIATPALAAPKVDLGVHELFRGITQPIFVTIINPDQKPLRDSLRWKVAEGWQIDPQDAPVHADPGQVLPCQHRILPVAGPAQKSGTISVSFGGSAAVREVPLKDPFSLQSLWLNLPAGATSGKWELELRNNTNQMLSGTLSVALPAGWTIPGGARSYVKDIQPGETVRSTIRFACKKGPAASTGTLRAAFRCQQAAVFAEESLP